MRTIPSTTTRLISLTAENFMRLVAVDITPDGNVVQISGANGAGKSSVLRALECALAGKGAFPSEPVRHGAEHAEITVDLGKYLVTRKIKPDGTTTLIVASPDGARFPSPQRLLDDLWSSLTFDPLAFSRMKPKEQRDQLAQMVGLSSMLDELAAADRVDFENRQNINRDLKRAQAQLEAMPVVEQCEPVDVSATLAELNDARQFNADAQRRDDSHAADLKMSAQWRSRASEKFAEAERLIAEGEELEKRAAELDAAIAGFESCALRDLSTLETRLSEAASRNKQHDAFHAHAAVAASVSKLEDESQALTDTMTQREAERAKVIAAAPFPIQGLALTDAGVTYNGVPFDQASSAEQLRVSAAIGMAMNDALRVMFIRDGSLLDEQSLAMLETLAEENDYQVILETVDTSGNVGVYIEDGRVAAVNGVAVAA